MHKNMPATTWQAWVHVFNYFTCLLDRGGSEFYDFYSHFIGEEVINDTTLDDKSRYLSITAVDESIRFIVILDMQN